MLGAVIGDIIGSPYEWRNVKSKDFPLSSSRTRFTDDTVMTLAVCRWLLEDPEHTLDHLVHCMQKVGRRHIRVGYGGNFIRWLMADHPKPYNSWGNGSAMRVSPVGLYADTVEETRRLARLTAEVSHNSPEGIKGAMAVAECVFLNRDRLGGTCGLSEIKDVIRERVTREYGYDLSRTLDEIRPNYAFDVSCQGSVPEAIIAFLESESLEDCARNAISIGGDSDTIAAIACSIYAANKECWDEPLMNRFKHYLSIDLVTIMEEFEKMVFPTRPTLHSFKVEERIYAGEYPRDREDDKSAIKMKQFARFGITHFIDLTEEGELSPYTRWMTDNMSHLRFPIRDVSIPQSTEKVKELVTTINRILDADPHNKVYIHCWGGVGRTGVIVGCLLADRQGYDYQQALETLRQLFTDCPKSAYRWIPETEEQCKFIEKYANKLKET